LPVTTTSIWLRRALTAMAFMLAATLPAAAQDAPKDSGFISTGSLPRIESDPAIRRPTLSLVPTWTDKEDETQTELKLSFGAPTEDRTWSAKLSVPLEYVDSGAKHVSGLADIALTVNRVISQGRWRQAASLQLTANTATNPSLGNGQWEVEGTYSVGRWFTPAFSTGMLLSWTYGFAVDSGRKRTDVIEPRLVFAFHFHAQRDFALDLRPRFDLTRNEFYSTLMVMMSQPLAKDYAMQGGFEFPLSQLAAKRVENSRIYFDFSRGF
jgi:hypothetical protein